ncbi:UNVERIFIED_ORG: SIMPL domain-containing protein [Shinella sp. XGS7]|nr:SIMPL domain-containing protein [Shinella sp. XGS7]
MKRIHATPATLALTLALAGVVGSAQAQTAPRKDALNLSATASQEVTRDTLAVVFSTTRDGSDAATVQRQLKQALDAALAEARKVAKPGEVEVQTGNFALYPRYAAKGGINGWQGSAELLVQGKDTATIAQLTGRINTLNIARVGYSLSREAREKVEAEVVSQAISRYKARAADYARQFGFSGYQIGEVSVNTSEGGGPMPMAAPMMRMKAAAVMDEALPVEAGKETVSVNVNGVVLMSK